MVLWLALERAIKNYKSNPTSNISKTDTQMAVFIIIP